MPIYRKSIARECLTTNVKNDEKLDSMKSHVSISFFLFSCLARFVKCLKYRLGSFEKPSVCRKFNNNINNNNEKKHI